MKIHWYWPFSRPEEMALAEAAATAGDVLRIDVIDRSVAPASRGGERVTIVRSLPDVDRSDLNKMRWMWSRALTYWCRARKRSAIWGREDFDLAHIHYLNRFTDIRLGVNRPPLVVISVHDVVPHQRRGPAAIEHRMLRSIYRRADALVVHHRTLKEALVEDFGVSADRVHVIAHQVFPVATELRSETPEHEVPTVLFFGALRGNKGIPLLVEVIRDMPLGINVRFHFAGHGDRELEALVVALASSDPRVDAEIGFASYERKAELFREASIVVLPYTQFSSQSGVLHDAYGHGRPVVVTDVGALGETVREDGTGLVVAPSDPAQLSDAITQLLNSDDQYTAMAASALRISAERSPERLGTELRRLYKTLHAHGS